MQLLQSIGAITVSMALLIQDPGALAASYPSYQIHTDARCTTIPSIITFAISDTCTDSATCTAMSSTSSSRGTDSSDGAAASADKEVIRYIEQGCTSDYIAASQAAFGNVPFVVASMYDTETCTTLSSVITVVANGSCVALDEENALQIAVSSNGSLTVKSFNGPQCNNANQIGRLAIQAAMVNGNACIGGSKYYLGNIVPLTAGSRTKQYLDTEGTTTVRTGPVASKPKAQSDHGSGSSHSLSQTSSASSSKVAMPLLISAMALAFGVVAHFV